MFTLNFNICLWVFIIHATIITQCLGYDFTKMPFACDFLVTSTGQRCMCCSSPTGLGFLFFSSHASEGLWDFPFVASQKVSSCHPNSRSTLAPNVTGLTYPRLVGSAFRQPSTPQQMLFPNNLLWSFPPSSLLYSLPEVLSGAAAKLGSCLVILPGLYCSMQQQ